MNRGAIGFPRGRRKQAAWTPNDFCGARVVRALSTVSVPHNTFTLVSFDTVRYDTDRFADLVNFPSRLRIPRDGFYHCQGASYIEFGGNSALAYFGIVKGTRARGDSAVKLQRHQIGNLSSSMVACVETVAHFAAGDYVQLELYQNTGLTKTAGSTTDDFELFNSLAVTRVG